MVLDPRIKRQLNTSLADVRLGGGDNVYLSMTSLVLVSGESRGAKNWPLAF